MIVRGSDTGREPLPAADDELRRLRSLWPAATVVDQANATPEVIVRELARATLFHYTGHAIANTIDASLSYLATGPAPLYVREVTRMRLPSLQLAFLAGCETAIAGGHEAAPESLATAFVLAGARNAAGSLWRVDDRVAAALSDRFYRELQRSGDAPRALRDVQVSFIRSGDPKLSSPAAWAAMQMYGSAN
jgi:CHAT domain-containing protein